MIAALAPAQLVLPGISVDQIVAQTAPDRVGARPAEERIIAGLAAQIVVARPAPDRISIVAA